MHPHHCLSVEDVYSSTAAHHSDHYDTPADGAFLLGRSVQGALSTAVTDRLLATLPTFLADDRAKVAAAGWCLATRPLLADMLAAGHLKIQIFRKVTLNNLDIMSSALDKSQRSTDNSGGLVPYFDELRCTYYICVLQVLYYMRLEADCVVSAGFDPAACHKYNIDVPLDDEGLCVEHQPLRIAVGKLWLAKGATHAMGALGCREAYEPTLGMPPDMVVVRNLSDLGPKVHGPEQEVLSRCSNSRYYGECYVHVDDICCQLGRTLYDPRDKCHCFLTCSKKSGKSQ